MPTYGEVEIPPCGSFLPFFFSHSHSNAPFFFIPFPQAHYFIPTVFLEQSCSRLLLVFTSMISFKSSINFSQRKSQVISCYSTISHWSHLTDLWIIFSVLCHISGMLVNRLQSLPPMLFLQCVLLVVISMNSFGRVPSFVGENFSFYVDCVLLINCCSSYLKGWYGTEARHMNWVNSHLRCPFAPASVPSLSREVTGPAVIISL